MLAELHQTQIAIPQEIITKLGLVDGDKLDIYERDGSISLIPVVTYPKEYLEELEADIAEVKAKIASGEQPVFDSVEAMFKALEAD